MRYLGASVPTESLIAMIMTYHPDLVALSTTMSFHITALRTVVTRIREATDGRVPVAIGGGACAWSPELRTELGVELTAASAHEIVDAATRHFGVGK